MSLPRLHLIELEECSWVPQIIRRGVVDALGVLLGQMDLYKLAIPDYLRWSRGASSVLDLASGSATHIDQILRKGLAGDAQAAGLKLTLSDINPNTADFQKVMSRYPERVGFHPVAVDARHPDAAAGSELRSMFSAFHHLRPAEARELLADAAQRSEGIFLFEPHTRKVRNLFTNLLGLIFGVVAALAVRPFSWSRLIFSTLIPVIPLVLAFDGVVSVLRTYTAEEMWAMIDSLPENDLEWEVKEVAHPVFPLNLFPSMVVTGRRRAAARAAVRDAKAA